MATIVLPLRSVAVALGALLVPLPSLAQPRSAAPRVSCAEAVGLVKAEGEVTVSFGILPPERFVRDRSFCAMTEIAELRFVPTRDNPQCPVGYRCREPDYGDWNWD